MNHADRPRLFLLLLTATIASPLLAPAATVTVGPADGRRINDLDGDTIFEGLGATSFPQLWATRYPSGAATAEVQFAIEFLLPPPPIGQSILSATLRLDEDQDNALTPDADLYGYAGDGVISTADANAGTLLQSNINDGVQGSYQSFDVTSFAQSSSGFIGFRVEATSVASFSSDQYRVEGPVSFSNGPPELVIEFGVIPEPQAVALAGAVAAIATAARNRRRSDEPTAA